MLMFIIGQRDDDIQVKQMLTTQDRPPRIA
jgi:hypothetical protein